MWPKKTDCAYVRKLRSTRVKATALLLFALLEDSTEEYKSRNDKTAIFNI